MARSGSRPKELAPLAKKLVSSTGSKSYCEPTEGTQLKDQPIGKSLELHGIFPR